MPIQIREAETPQDMLHIEKLERTVWGYTDDALVGKDMLLALRHAGACIAIAWDDATPIGFVLSFPTARADTQHSHMLGVIPAYRGGRVALELKLWQRAWCLVRHIPRVVWTFDPLRALNAHFNIAKLGCTAQEYLPHLYGEMAGINAGVRSDRLVAEWDLLAPQGKAVTLEPIPSVNTVELGEMTGADWGLLAPRVYFELPEDFGTLLERDPPAAIRWRERSSPLFVHYLARYRVIGFRRQGGNAYLLERVPEDSVSGEIPSAHAHER